MTIDEIPKIDLPDRRDQKAIQAKQMITYLRFCLKDFVQPDLTRSEIDLIITALAEYETALLLELQGRRGTKGESRGSSATEPIPENQEGHPASGGTD